MVAGCTYWTDLHPCFSFLFFSFLSFFLSFFFLPLLHRFTVHVFFFYPSEKKTTKIKKLQKKKSNALQSWGENEPKKKKKETRGEAK